MRVRGVCFPASAREAPAMEPLIRAELVPCRLRQGTAGTGARPSLPDVSPKVASSQGKRSLGLGSGPSQGAPLRTWMTSSVFAENTAPLPRISKLQARGPPSELVAMYIGIKIEPASA